MILSALHNIRADRVEEMKLNLSLSVINYFLMKSYSMANLPQQFSSTGQCGEQKPKIDQRYSAVQRLTHVEQEKISFSMYDLHRLRNMPTNFCLSHRQKITRKFCVPHLLLRIFRLSIIYGSLKSFSAVAKYFCRMSISALNRMTSNNVEEKIKNWYTLTSVTKIPIANSA